MALPFVAPAVGAEPAPIEQAAAAVDIAGEPQIISHRISPSTVSLGGMPQSPDKLFALPFIQPVAAAEPKPLALATAAVEIVKKPHLLLWRIAPSTVPLSDLLPAPPEEIEVAVDPAMAPVEAMAAEPLPSLPAASAEIPPAEIAPAAQMAAPMAAAIEESAVPVSSEPPPGAPESSEEQSRSLASKSGWWTRLPQMWSGLPIHVRALAMVTPIALILAFSRALPSVPGTTGSKSIEIQKALTQGLGSVRQQLASRAAIDFTDDFRTGLDDWQGRGNTTAEWSYDAAGFVRPAKLALFRPTLSLQDYRFEFLGEIDEKAMGCVFRATDPDNYYAIKFAVSNPGPMPLVKLVRYAVVDGHEERHQERPLPFLSSVDTLYRVLIDVHGDDFTIMSQGKVVDFWTDDRLKTGGVGLFCGRGERARVRWVEVSHQYDTLGRLCAYLAPYSGQGRIGSLN